MTKCDICGKEDKFNAIFYRWQAGCMECYLSYILQEGTLEEDEVDWWIDVTINPRDF